MPKYILRDTATDSLVAVTGSLPLDLRGRVAAGTYAPAAVSDEGPSITVGAATAPEALSAIPSQYRVVGSTATLNLAPFFLSGTAMTFAATGLPAGFSVSSIGVLTMAPSEAASGVYDFTVGNSAGTTSFTIALTAADVPSAYTVGMWTLTPVAGGVRVDILSPPSANFSSVTRTDYRIGSGAATPLPADGVIAAPVSATAVQIADVNDIGPGAWSDTKTETPLEDTGSFPTITTEGENHTSASASTYTRSVTGAAVGRKIVMVGCVDSNRDWSGIPTGWDVLHRHVYSTGDCTSFLVSRLCDGDDDFSATVAAPEGWATKAWVVPAEAEIAFSFAAGGAPPNPPALALGAAYDAYFISAVAYSGASADLAVGAAPSGYTYVGTTASNGTSSGATKVTAAARTASASSEDPAAFENNATSPMSYTIGIYLPESGGGTVDLLETEWGLAEAASDLLTRQVVLSTSVSPPSGKKWAGVVSVQDNPPLSGLTDLTLSAGVWSFTTSAQESGVTVYGRIALVDTVTDVAESASQIVKSVTVSSVPSAPAATWTNPANGTIRLTFATPIPNGRAILDGRYNIDGGSWSTFSVGATLDITGLSDGSQTINLQWRNANGYSGTASIPVTVAAQTSPPSFTVRHTLVGRTVTVFAENITGTPAPTMSLSAMTAGGSSVLGSVTGSNPWVYDVPSSTSATAIAYTVQGAGSTTVTASGSLSVPANLTEPPPPSGAVTDFPSHTVDAVPGTVGALDINILSVPANATELWARVQFHTGAVADFLITETPAVATFRLDLPALYHGRRVWVHTYGRNALGAGPTTEYPSIEYIEYDGDWVAGPPVLVARIKTDTVRPGDTVILTVDTIGWPEPTISGFDVTLDGTPVSLEGDGSVRTFVAPSDSAGKVISLTVAGSNTHASVTNTATKTVSAALPGVSPVSVATRAELDAAIAAAVNGSVINLASGDYGALTWSRGSAITVKLVGPADRSASFTALTCSGSSRGGMWVERITCNGNLRIQSANCTVKDCQLNGDNRLISASNCVFIDNVCDATDVGQCMTIQDTAGAYIARNSFLNSIYDLVRIAGATLDTVFEYNILRRVQDYPLADYSSNHPDLLQLFGLAGNGSTVPDRSPNRVWVRRNYCYDIVAAQGIFCTDPRTSEGYRNIAMTENLIRCSFGNRLAVSKMSLGCLVANNSVNGNIVWDDHYGGLVTKNLSTEIYRHPNSNWSYSSFVDNSTAVTFEGFWSGDLSVITHFIPLPGLGISDEYGATVWVKTL